MILHVDVDAFFASVEQLLIPFLRGKPVIVGSGCIASCSYEARKFGLHAGMSLREAKKLCPRAVILKGDYQIYRCFAEQIWKICGRYTVGLETFLDEAYGDATGMDTRFGGAIALAKKLQQDVRDEVGLPVSVGLATNRMVAGIASHLAKPSGVAYVPPGDEERFVGPLPIEELTGVGHRTAKELHDMNIRTVEQLRLLPLATLSAMFGRRGEILYERCRGRDVAAPIATNPPEEEVVVGREAQADGEADCELRIANCPSAVSSGPNGEFNDDCGLRSADCGSSCELPGEPCGADAPASASSEKIRNSKFAIRNEPTANAGVRRLPKTISRETTFHQPLTDLDQIRGMIFYLLERAMRTLRQGRLASQCIEVHIRYDDFRGDAASKSLPEPTDADDRMFDTALELLKGLYRRRVALRHVGVSLSRLTRRDDQRTLFDFEADDRRHELYRACDEIRDRFGHAAIVGGKSIELLGRLDQNDYGFVLRTPSLTK